MSIHVPGADASELCFKGVYMAGTSPGSRWDVCCKRGLITSLDEHRSPGFSGDSETRFLTPSLCHPHIHLDKCFLLSHPKYADLEIKQGDFSEAMNLTSEAKARFEHEDLMERGRAMIAESVNFGVTHMRAFVEVDLGVGMKCLEAGLALKEEFRDRCYVQICVFAQDPIFSYPDKGKAMMGLLESAVIRPEVEAFGSTPYVEKDGSHELQIQNMEFAIRTAQKHKLHLDFHIDYNLDPTRQSQVLEGLRLLEALDWPSNPSDTDYRSISMGHCTRLTLFDHNEWVNLRNKARGLPVSFIGLPTSDLFMMGRPKEEDERQHQRARGTIQVLHMIQKYGLDAAIGINNVGNAFTPQGSCDPLSLASLTVGIYQAATREATNILLQCVSTRARFAIGLSLSGPDLALKVGDPANLLVTRKDPQVPTATFS